MSIPAILYTAYIYAIPLIIFAALYAFRWKVGMWGNCLTYGAVTFSALIALGWWEDVAYLLAKQVPMLLFLVDNIAIWVLFLISLLILDTATRFLSTVKVKFNDTVENVGNGIAIGAICVALYTFSIIANLHLGMAGEHHNTAALKNNPAVNGTISAVRILSGGNLSTFTEGNRFDDGGKFLELHHQRRQAIMLSWQESKDMRADEGLIGNMGRERR